MGQQTLNDPKPFDPDWVIHPGAFLLEEMCARFTEGTDLDHQVLERFIEGDQQLTPEILDVLTAKLETSPELWHNSEHIFREGLAAGKTWVK
jgi:plasmid maintenance system antidote protein VapI